MSENQQKPTLSLSASVSVKKQKPSQGRGKKQGFKNNRHSFDDKPQRRPQDKRHASKGSGKDRGKGKSMGAKPQMSRVDGLPANRIAAYEVARLVLLQDHYLDKALAENERLKSLYPTDRQFVRMMVTSLLRHHTQLDGLLSEYVTRKPPAEAFLILMMGAVQLLLMRTPQHAALSTSVDLMRAAGFDHMTGMTNAILRKLSQKEIDLLASPSLSSNIAPDMLKAWQKAYGYDRVAAFVPHLFAPPQIDLSFADEDKAKAEAAKRDGICLTPTTIRVPLDGDITKWDGFEAGDWWVQDIAASLPAHLLGDIKGKSVIDMCAAPGGKTAQLLAKGASVTALEIDGKRAKRLGENLDRLHMKCVIEEIDALNYTPVERPDAVLLDAPCSATGTIRKRPDVMRKDIRDDLCALPKMQEALARRAIAWLNHGGILVFATCSLQPQEGEEIVKKLVSGPRAVAKTMAITTQEAGDFATSLTEEGWLRLLPDSLAGKGGNDGFFIARLARL